MDSSYSRQNSREKEKKKYLWQKKHLENQTGSKIVINQ